MGFLGGCEVDQAIPLVYRLYGARSEIIHAPVARCQLANEVTLVVIEVEVRMPISSRGPHELPSALQERQFVVQLDPTVAGFGKNGSRVSASNICEQEIQTSLVAAFSLDRDGVAVRHPVHARQVNVLLGTKIKPRRG